MVVTRGWEGREMGETLFKSTCLQLIEKYVPEI